MQTKIRKFLGTYNESEVNNRHAGFTLIELLVVISIIGFLAAVVMSSLQAARERALDAQIKSDLSQVRNALELYAIDHGYTYPVMAASYQKDDIKVAETSTSYSENLIKFFVKKVYAQDQVARPQNCERFDALSSALVPTYIGAMPRHPLDAGTDVCYQYFVNGAGSTAVAYAPLVTERYSAGFSRQAGIVVGITDVPALRAICEENLTLNSGDSAPFPLFTDPNHRCEGQIADIVLGVENGTGDIAVGDSCSLTQYTTQQACELDRSTCSDSQYTSAGQTVCEANGSTAQGTCSGGGLLYTTRSTCEDAAYNQGEGCTNGTYGNQVDCLAAQCESTAAYCTGGYSYTDPTSCTTAGYVEPSCSAGGFGSQSECVSAQCEFSQAYCSNSMYTDPSGCSDNGYQWTYAVTGPCGYMWNPGSSGFGYQWIPAVSASCNYSWNPGIPTPYNYVWTDGAYTPNTWTSVPGGQWGSY